MTAAEEKAEKAKAMIKAVYDDGEAVINGNAYKLLKMTHKQRRKVYAYMTSIAPAMARGDMSFLDANEFVPVERVIQESITFDDMQLSKLPDHWDDHPNDYIPFITTVLSAISWPFMSADHTA